MSVSGPLKVYRQMEVKDKLTSPASVFIAIGFKAQCHLNDYAAPFVRFRELLASDGQRRDLQDTYDH